MAGFFSPRLPAASARSVFMTDGAETLEDGGAAAAAVAAGGPGFSAQLTFPPPLVSLYQLKEQIGA